MLMRASARRLPVAHIAFTDSYHIKKQVSMFSPALKSLFADAAKVVNFVPHTAPVGTPVEAWTSQEYNMTSEQKGCSCVSACTTDHASTNYVVMDAAFEFFAAKQ